MVEDTGPVPSLAGQDRRRIATRSLADATGIDAAGTAGEAGGRVRRPASALTGHRRDRLVASTI